MRYHLIVDVPDWKTFGDVMKFADEKLQPILLYQFSARIVGIAQGPVFEESA